MRHRRLALLFSLAVVVFACSDKSSDPPADETFGHGSPRPECQCTTIVGRPDAVLPQTVDTERWGNPIKLGAPINSAAEDKMPAFAANAPDTMYFVSDRDNLGSVIYRSVRSGGIWQTPTPVIQGQVGEPTLPADGSIMYFVHVLTDGAADPVFGADVYYVERK